MKAKVLIEKLMQLDPNSEILIKIFSLLCTELEILA